MLTNVDESFWSKFTNILLQKTTTLKVTLLGWRLRQNKIPTIDTMLRQWVLAQNNIIFKINI